MDAFKELQMLEDLYGRGQAPWPSGRQALKRRCVTQSCRSPSRPASYPSLVITVFS
jgi:hypothetical protein